VSRTSECVEFHAKEACQAVCPVECCVPNENNVETEEALYDRAVKLHPEQAFPPFAELTSEQSRFRA